MSFHLKQKIHHFLSSLITCPAEDLDQLASIHIADQAIWDVSAPFHRLTGRDEILSKLIRPLRAAFTGLHRRDDIFIGNQNRRDYGGYWISSTTHYVGNFTHPFLKITPSQKLVFLRAGEFYRLQDQQIIEAKIIFDFVDLLRQADQFPFDHSLGTEILFPTPATQDGVLPNQPDLSETSLDLVEAMLGDLRDFDPDNFQSANQTGTDGYWHERMMWYGPAGVGSNYRWDGFEKDHRIPFLTAFPDRVGGNHYCRIGDGAYASVSGWPSMTMTHKGDYLGIAATDKSLTLRVMDFYRCDYQGPSPKIIENWVYLDYVDLFDQMGVALLP